MKQIPKEWLALIIIVILVVGISIFELRKSSAPTPNKANSSNLTNNAVTRLEKEENNVTVIIEYLPNQSQSSLIFRVALDTHSVDLDSFDFAKDIALDKEGKSASSTLLKQEGSGHHRSAEITFPQTSFPFTIIFKNLSNIPRREFYFGNSKKSYKDITSDELYTMLTNKDFYFVNVHIPYEGEIEKTDAFIPYNEIDKNLDKLPKDKNAKIVLYCRSGRMSAEAAVKLTDLGYTNVYNHLLGIHDWQARGYKILKKPS